MDDKERDQVDLVLATTGSSLQCCGWSLIR